MSIADSPYASVCILSFNRPKLLKETIRSAIRNAGHPFELIVHDDGSDEETRDMLHDLQEDGLISLLMLNAPGNNEGQGVALNRMFGAATGDPIVKMDHDLILEPDWLVQSVDLLRANEAEHWADLQNLSPPRIGALGLFKYEHPPVDYREMLLAARTTQDGTMWEEHRDFVGSVMVIPRVAWEEFGPFEERSPAFAEDAVWKQKLAELPGWCNALPVDDLAVNVGFGLGPSTVNLLDQKTNEVVVQSIHESPLIVND